MPISSFPEIDFSRILTTVRQSQDLLDSVGGTRGLHEISSRAEELRSRMAPTPTRLWDNPTHANARRAMQQYLNANPYWESSGLLIKYLETANLDQELHFYNQALSCLECGHYEACNAILRSFLQSLLTTIYKRVKNRKAKSIKSAISLLHNIGLISKVDTEWLHKKVSEFNTNGSHPGYSNKEEATQRFCDVTSIGHSLLKDYCHYRKQTHHSKDTSK